MNMTSDGNLVEVEDSHYDKSSPPVIIPFEGKENGSSISKQYRCQRVCPYYNSDGNRLVSTIRGVNGNGAFYRSEFTLIPTWNSGFAHRLQQLKMRQNDDSKRKDLDASDTFKNDSNEFSDKENTNEFNYFLDDHMLNSQENQSENRLEAKESQIAQLDPDDSVLANTIASLEDVSKESSAEETEIQEKEIPKIPASIIIEFIGSYTNDRKVWNALASLNRETFAMSKSLTRFYRPWPSIRWRATTITAKGNRRQALNSEQRHRRRTARGAVQTSARIRTVSFAKDYLCYATDQGDVLFRSVHGDGSINVRRGHLGCVNSIKCYGNWMVSAGDDFETKIWNVKTMSCEAILDDHAESITSISILPFNGYIQGSDESCILVATAGLDGDVHLYAVYCEGDKVVYTKHLAIFAEEIHSKSIFAVVLYEKDGHLNLVSGGLDGRLRLWDVNAAVGDRAESCYDEVEIEIPAIKIVNNTCIYRYDGEIKSIAISRDKARIAVAFGRTICHSYLSGKTLQQYDYLHHHDHNHRFQRRLEQQRRLRNQGQSHEDVGTNSVVETEEDHWKVLKKHTGDIRCIDFSPDGKTVASACSDGSIRLWQLGEGTWRRKWKAHNGFMVCSLAFSPDGQSLLSAGSDGTIAIEDLFS